MSKTKTDDERKFYLKLASKEKYKARELERQIDSGYYERLLLSDGKAPSGIDHTETTGMIRDLYMLEFLNLPEPYKEFDLKQAILKNMKQFLLEIGRDFIFMGEEFHLQVGKNDYFVDLLFYHRELQCLVAIDLKIDDFKPEYLGKMEFYLEALDRDIKKPHENPSVGIILCKSRDEDVVEYALSRNMSSTMISEYRTKLISKEILQKKLEELYDAADESQNSQQCWEFSNRNITCFLESQRSWYFMTQVIEDYFEKWIAKQISEHEKEIAKLFLQNGGTIEVLKKSIPTLSAEYIK